LIDRARMPGCRSRRSVAVGARCRDCSWLRCRLAMPCLSPAQRSGDSSPHGAVGPWPCLRRRGDRQPLRRERRPSLPPRRRFGLPPPPAGPSTISRTHRSRYPDGSQIAFVAMDAGRAQSIWIRPMTAVDAQPVPAPMVRQR
jgi:hypothetical protein